jgi:hypothetical protein
MAFKCYKGSTLIKNIYAGSTKVKKVYKGSTLVWQADPYEPGTVLYESSTGGASTTLSLEEGLYRVICIAAGGGGATNGFDSVNNSTSAGSGGSGSGFNCVLSLSKGNYQVLVGSGGSNFIKTKGGTAGNGTNSRFGNCFSYAGKGGVAKDGWKTGVGGSGGTNPTIAYTVVSTVFNSAGNSGSGTTNGTVKGGAALYKSYGKGGNAKTTHSSGGSYSSDKGNSGYIKVVYIGQA